MRPRPADRGPADRTPAGRTCRVQRPGVRHPPDHDGVADRCLFLSDGRGHGQRRGDRGQRSYDLDTAVLSDPVHVAPDLQDPGDVLTTATFNVEYIGSENRFHITLTASKGLFLKTVIDTPPKWASNDSFRRNSSPRFAG